MTQTAKIFSNGRSQAVRLPASYRFKEKEIYIRQDPKTKDIILSRKPSSWEGFFQLVETLKISPDFMSDRKDSPPQKRKIF